MRRNITRALAILAIAGLSWYGLSQYRKHKECKRRRTAFAWQIENIKRDAQGQLKVGTKKSEVSRFFADHGMPFSVVDSMAFGTLPTSGCAPFGCGSDSAMIGVRVKLNYAGAVMEEPKVVDLYTDCL